VMRRMIAACFIGSILTGCTTALPGEQPADVARVRVTIDRELARGCTFVGMASDTSETDLQRKAAWLGGNLALVTLESREARAAASWYASVVTTAEVYRCEGDGKDRAELKGRVDCTIGLMDFGPMGAVCSAS